MTEPKTRAGDDATIPSAHRSTITVSELNHLVAATQEMDALFQHTIGWWRGHAKAEWKLQAQVFRREGPSSLEICADGSFCIPRPFAVD